MLWPSGPAYLDLAEILYVAGRRQEAAAEIERALELFEHKSDLPMAAPGVGGPRTAPLGCPR
jgi:hypothetical protein